MLVSFAICTYNRGFIIEECINSIYREQYDSTQFEVLLIDNNSTDNTQHIATLHQQKHTNFKYIHESKQGLSHARNKAYLAARAPWVFYIDDDATLGQNFIQQTINIIKNYDFDAFGGMYYPWYKYGKPKWLPNHFGQSNKLLDHIGTLHKGLLSGGVLCIKKEWLIKTNGFQTNLGMTGTNIGYGEEDEWQIRAKKAGIKIGFVPSLYINHCVLPHKLKLSWHLKAEYQHGVAQYQLFESNVKCTRIALRLLKLLIVKTPKNTIHFFIHLLFNRNYFWQNYLLNILQPIYRTLGKFKAACS